MYCLRWTHAVYWLRTISCKAMLAAADNYTFSRVVLKSTWGQHSSDGGAGH